MPTVQGYPDSERETRTAPYSCAPVRRCHPIPPESLPSLCRPLRQVRLQHRVGHRRPRLVSCGAPGDSLPAEQGQPTGLDDRDGREVVDRVASRHVRFRDFSFRKQTGFNPPNSVLDRRRSNCRGADLPKARSGSGAAPRRANRVGSRPERSHPKPSTPPHEGREASAPARAPPPQFFARASAKAIMRLRA